MSNDDKHPSVSEILKDQESAEKPLNKQPWFWAAISCGGCLVVSFILIPVLVATVLAIGPGGIQSLTYNMMMGIQQLFQ